MPSDPTTFARLPIGAVFVFSSEVEYPEWGLPRGPWRKLSARTYQAADDTDALVCRVGQPSVSVYVAE